MAFIRYSKW